jgi:hypothetical protein
MSKYYNPQKGSAYCFDPKRNGSADSPQAQPFRLSRSKIDLFLECQRCFYIDRRMGIGRPPGFPFSLNSAVDGLLKKEFDGHRAAGTPHPFMKAYGLDAVPFQHLRMDEWRDSLRRGVTYVDPKTNFNVTGGVDDVWVNPKGELIIVDYKATAKAGEVSLDAEWQDGYKRQMETYQWLFRKNGFQVSPTGYFVYVNGKMDAEAFDARLEFDVKLIPYTGDTAWVEPTLIKAKNCLMSDEIPAAHEECDYCRYRSAVSRVENKPQAAEEKKSVKKVVKPKSPRGESTESKGLF